MRALLAISVLLVLAAPAPAAVRLSREPADLRALAVTTAGEAYALVDSQRPTAPFALVRSWGRRVIPAGSVGERDAEFPELAAGPGPAAATVAWTTRVSGGSLLRTMPVPVGGARPRTVGYSTGPAPLLVTDAAAILAHPDRRGDAALTTVRTDGSTTEALTADAPERRHHILDIAEGPDGPLVLDLVQQPGRTELRVLGPGAPAAPVFVVGGLRHVPASLAASRSTIAVAYLSSGRAKRATARPGGAWRLRTLPGPGGGTGPAGVAVHGDDVVVAYPQRVRAGRGRRQQEVFAHSELGGRSGLRRVTRGPGDDAGVMVAGGPRGQIYVAWTSRRRSGAVPLLHRLR